VQKGLTVSEQKPVELRVFKIPRDPRIVDADIGDLPAVASPEPSLPLEHELLNTLRGLNLDDDRDQAIKEIARAFDQAEIRKLAQVLDWFKERLGDGSAGWLAIKGLMDSPLRKATQKDKLARWVETIKRRVKMKNKKSAVK
jgi:hypothetical protein